MALRDVLSLALTLAGSFPLGTAECGTLTSSCVAQVQLYSV